MEHTLYLSDVHKDNYLVMYVGAYSALVLEVYYALIANIKSIYRNLGVTQLSVINEQKLQF